jgi:hypothetical protein
VTASKSATVSKFQLKTDPGRKPIPGGLCSGTNSFASFPRSYSARTKYDGVPGTWSVTFKTKDTLDFRFQFQSPKELFSFGCNSISYKKSQFHPYPSMPNVYTITGDISTCNHSPDRPPPPGFKIAFAYCSAGANSVSPLGQKLHFDEAVALWLPSGDWVQAMNRCPSKKGIANGLCVP